MGGGPLFGFLVLRRYVFDSRWMIVRVLFLMTWNRLVSRSCSMLPVFSITFTSPRPLASRKRIAIRTVLSSKRNWHTLRPSSTLFK